MNEIESEKSPLTPDQWAELKKRIAEETGAFQESTIVNLAGACQEIVKSPPPENPTQENYPPKLKVEKLGTHQSGAFRPWLPLSKALEILRDMGLIG